VPIRHSKTAAAPSLKTLKSNAKSALCAIAAQSTVILPDGSDHCGIPPPVFSREAGHSSDTNRADIPISSRPSRTRRAIPGGSAAAASTVSSVHGESGMPTMRSDGAAIAADATDSHHGVSGNLGVNLTLLEEECRAHPQGSE
jgi:hypothetical protein